MEEYVAGVDIGTTGAKALIVSLSGKPLGSAYREYPCEYPKPNWVEQDADLLVSSTMEALKEAVANSGCSPESIKAISVSAQRCCGIFLDKDEKQVRPMISWQDNRTTEEIEEISQKLPPEDFYHLTGFPISTTWLISKMIWVRKNQPDVWEKTAKVVQMHDYFLRALGVEDYYVDHNDAGFYGFFDTEKLCWNQDILDLFDLDKALLPIPEASSTPVGNISERASELCGLAKGTVIAIGAGDQSAGSLGTGVVKTGDISVSMGTAGALNACLTERICSDNRAGLVTNHTQTGMWLWEGHQSAAASVYRWFRDEIAALEYKESIDSNSDYYERLNEMIAAVPVGAKGLVFLPYLAGASTPRYNPDARGTMLGLTLAHDRACLARAFMEGITLDMYDIIQSLKSTGYSVNSARILGGPTRSKVWNQIQSDIYGIPVNTLEVSDAALIGAAILAAKGAGKFSTIAEGAETMVRITDSYEPDMANHAVYSEMYGVYCDAYEGLTNAKVFESLAKLQGSNQ